jgi:ubiquinone/menaquinone biosynthesis C-methylase UbiE
VTREQRLVFGEVAEQYDRVRPGYPASLVDEVVQRASVHNGEAVLEVGCGTGKATIPFASRALRVVALEPDENMAAVARRNCDGLDVSVETTSFEDWDGDRRSFALLISAQAWHWTRPGSRLEKAHRVLRRAGTIALFWNRPDWPDTPLRHAVDAVYTRVAPELSARTPGRSPQDARRRAVTDELESSPLFDDFVFSEHPWSTSYDTTEYVQLLATQSDHRMLVAEQREQLFSGVADAIDAAGGVVPVAYVADLYLARRVG